MHFVPKYITLPPQNLLCSSKFLLASQKIPFWLFLVWRLNLTAPATLTEKRAMKKEEKERCTSKMYMTRTFKPYASKTTNLQAFYGCETHAILFNFFMKYSLRFCNFGGFLIGAMSLAQQCE